MTTPTPPLDTAHFEVWADFVLGYTRVMRLIEKRLRATAGLTWAQYDVLYNLNNGPGEGLSVTGLSRTLLYSSGSASNLVGSMEKAGLVDREQSSSDRRVSLIRTTEKGRSAFEAATVAVLEVVRDEFAAPLTDAELPAVAAFLRRIREADPNLARPPYNLPVTLP
ncbi:MarR family winged helix-turn-helix transcriptional regulator [Herbiconiux solani]|uniref:MarR family winged helix-turn-helix transcriptional regulator n=1 Tax=Herbiconiux solani TaxID=661329 RepID=UPI000826491E|nr:MarR family transcriptional regulator [Herbiconiux solani]